MTDEADALLETGADEGQAGESASRIALACSRLGPADRELVERVLARGGRATLDEVAADPVAIARLERVTSSTALPGWFGFDPGAPRAGPQARILVAPDVLELVASAVAGVPPLRRRPVRFLSLEARLEGLHGPARSVPIGRLHPQGLPARPETPSVALDLELAPARDVARALARPEAARARARAGGEGVLALVEELLRRGGIAPLISLPRAVRETALAPDSPLERLFLGEVGRLDRPCALLAREVLEGLALEAAPPAPAQGPARPLLAGALLAVFPALALAREGELRETRRGVLEKRARERLERLLGTESPLGGRALAPPRDEPELFARALVAAGLLEAREDGALAPGPAAPVFASGGTRERAQLLVRGYAEAASPPGGEWPGAVQGLAAAVQDELASLEGPAPPDLPARLGVYRWLERGDRTASDPDGLELTDLAALAATIALPAAEAVGLVAVEPGGDGAPARVWPTPLAAAVRGGAAPERCAILSADGEAVVLPLAGAAEAALDLSRVAERTGSGEVLRFRLTATSVRGAQARPEELEALLDRLRARARGEVPESFERLLRDAGAASVRARTSVLRVLEVPRVAFADRAARVLGERVIDRLTPTLLVLREPLSPADRRALAREGIFVD